VQRSQRYSHATIFFFPTLIIYQNFYHTKYIGATLLTELYSLRYILSMNAQREERSMGLSREKYRAVRHGMILVAELARNGNDSQEFFDAIPLYERPQTSREVHALAVAHRSFREASAAPLEALIADRHAKVRRIKGEGL
jgi:hypothetical protein